MLPYFYSNENLFKKRKKKLEEMFLYNITNIIMVASDYRIIIQYLLKNKKDSARLKNNPGYSITKFIIAPVNYKFIFRLSFTHKQNTVICLILQVFSNEIFTYFCMDSTFHFNWIISNAITWQETDFSNLVESVARSTIVVCPGPAISIFKKKEPP